MSRLRGLTSPVSYDGPTEKDLRLSEKLRKTLKDAEFYEEDQESIHREKVLGELNSLVQNFIKDLALEKGVPAELARSIEGKIFTFGSYRLGVHAKGADIDTLLVAPQHVSRDDFFTKFIPFIKDNQKVSDIVSVPEAYVPVIKMCFDGISIDLVFSKIPCMSINKDFDLLDSNILRNLDEKCAISLNGSRATDEILRLVPNVPDFHLALSCIKLWAKRRLLYGNVTGYFAGISLALLVARVCQLYPNASASRLVNRFFVIYNQWKWPNPVFLKPMEDLGLGKKIWNPKIYPADMLHKMPIITPAYPSMCSTHNISTSTFNIILEEFVRGIGVTEEIESEKAGWEILLEQKNFFDKYENYCQIICVCDDKEDLQVWSGYVESKIRLLSGRLEQIDGISIAPANTCTYSKSSLGLNKDCVIRFFNKEPPKDRAKTETDEKMFYSVGLFIGLGIVKKTGGIDQNKISLSGAVREFKTLISSWEKRKKNMSIIIKQVKKSSIPENIINL